MGWEDMEFYFRVACDQGISKSGEFCKAEHEVALSSEDSHVLGALAVVWIE